MTTVYLGLGSNLSGDQENPAQQLDSAISSLEQHSAIEIVAISPYYQSEPVGPAGQPDYINGVCAIHTALKPEALLNTTQAIENRQGRIRNTHWGPRTLDIDILLYGNDTISSPRLTVPHPHMPQRNFVLYPLRDIAPGLRFPCGQSISALIETLEQSQKTGYLSQLSTTMGNTQ
ncbi:MAG: 2-amino-4-hydroxy-6-hydroxymethyldihydropteridine diphosphokinase [Cellvibrionaceae bacterium]